MSNDEDVPKSVVCTCCGAGYDAGANTALMVIVAAVSTVTKVVTCPLWSVSTVQLPAPPHVEKATAGVAGEKNLAPAPGGTPTGGGDRAPGGVGACPPPPRGGVRPP